MCKQTSFKEPKFIVVDLFCGAGGTTTGFVMTGGAALVAACVNHDHKAIKSHWRNNPEVEHFEEDITKLYGYLRYGYLFHSPEFMRLIRLVNIYRAFFPNAKVILWASLECTNFSKAKGGLPRDPDSRTLADHLHYYIDALQPDYIQIENVVEFRDWGPMRIKCAKMHEDRCDLMLMKNKKGDTVYGWEPIPEKKGEDYKRWCAKVCDQGYCNDWKELNSADFGAYTSRNRLFGIFARPELPIAWPEPTHYNPKKVKKAKAKKKKKVKVQGDLFSSNDNTLVQAKSISDGLKECLAPWKPVKEVLKFEDEGESIFNRKKPLSNKTLERIYAGLVKYVAKGDTAFISKYFSGRPKGKVNSVNEPSPTVTTFGGNSLVQAKTFSDLPVTGPTGAITTIDHHSLVQVHPISLLKYNSTNKDGSHTPPSLESPSPVISCQGRLGLVQGAFLSHYYSQGGQHSSIEQPAPTIPCKARTALVSTEFLTIYNGKSVHASIDDPCPTIPTKDRFQLISPAFLVNYNHRSKESDIESPSPALLTHDKLALAQPEYLISPHYGKSQNQSIEQPAGTILTNDKHRLVQCEHFLMPTQYNNPPKSIDDPAPPILASRRHTYIVNPSHGGYVTSTQAPCPVIIARQDKAPLYLVQAENGGVSIEVYETDSEPMVRIKVFMAFYGLVDIKMRMLRVDELLEIQGFPKHTRLEGNQADQKKQIGNSVVPLVVAVWTYALEEKLEEIKKAA